MLRIGRFQIEFHIKFNAYNKCG